MQNFSTKKVGFLKEAVLKTSDSRMWIFDVDDKILVTKSGDRNLMTKIIPPLVKIIQIHQC